MNNKYLIAIIALIVLVGAYLLFTNSQNRELSEENNQIEQTLDDEQDADEQTELAENDAPSGKITGALSYPSEGIPAEMQVCAETISKSAIYCTDAQLSGPQYQYGKGFELVVPTGSYHVFATLAADPKSPNAKRAYYNEFVKCGLSVDCKDTTPIVVAVGANATVSNINPWDWYN